MNELPFAQATVSEHLRKLKNVGLITVREKGSASEYILNKQVLKHFMEMQTEMETKFLE